MLGNSAPRPALRATPDTCARRPSSDLTTPSSRRLSLAAAASLSAALELTRCSVSTSSW